jgi:1-acyl-sn-glycerol-3-phosphate acyltransferase
MNIAAPPLARATKNRGTLSRLLEVAPEEAAEPTRGLHPIRQLRSILATIAVLAFLPPTIAIQSILLLLPGRQKAEFAAFFWASIARFVGLQIRVIGAPLPHGARPIIYVCNHSSWLDIPAVGGVLRACFVAKGDVAGWPIIGTVARLGRTIFVSRNRTGTIRERDDMQARLAAGDDLILFPEGTSSDGARVLPFRSAFFAAAYGDAKPIIQPVSIVFDRLAGLPVSHASRAVFAWYGDMDLLPHYWQVVQWRGKRASLLFHAPLDPADFPDRKALSQAAWEAVADGAAALRQNRAAYPLPRQEPHVVATPAFA